MRPKHHSQHATNGGNNCQEINIVYLWEPHLATMELEQCKVVPFFEWVVITVISQTRNKNKQRTLNTSGGENLFSGDRDAYAGQD